ncbi:GNAT family N-acetyltransferase [Buchananella felis]|uniref:GNAT family N-acetyltransferase n=1 Tax=Buchananella felis TaxID=3231492 RepID=UPI00352825AD
MQIVPVQTSDSARLGQYVSLLSTALLESGEETAALNVEDMVARIQRPVSGWEERFWLAFPAGANPAEPGVEPIGFAIASWSIGAANADAANLNLWVSAAHRGRGIGTALLEHVVSELPAHLTRFFSYVAADMSGGPIASSDLPSPRFARDSGFRVTELCHLRRHPWPIDATLLESLDPSTVDMDGRRRLGAYSIETYVDGVPADLQDSFARLLGLVEAEAPHGDVDLEPEEITAEIYRQGLERTRTAKATRVESVAVLTHPDGSREAVGMSSYTAPAQADALIEVNATIVDRAHRGHRLGWAIKCAVERRLLELNLPHKQVNSCNADSNQAMLAINHALGFREVLQIADLFGERATVSERLAERRARHQAANQESQ